MMLNDTQEAAEDLEQFWDKIQVAKAVLRDMKK